MNTSTHSRSAVLHAGTWLLGGAVVLGYTAVEVALLLKRPAEFSLKHGPEQSVTIFLAVGLASLAMSVVRYRGFAQGWAAYKVIATLLLLLSLVWLVFGGPTHEPWPFSVAVGLVLISSAWQLLLRRNGA